MEGSGTNISSKSLSSYLSNSKLDDPLFWRDKCACLKISEDSNGQTSSKEGNSQSSLMLGIGSEESERKRSKLVSKGYVLVDEPFDCDLVGSVKKGIEQLHEIELPATFVLLFDEAWSLARASRSLLDKCTHCDNHFNFDLLAWYIEPGKGGFSPHRDRQPENASSTFHSDKQAKFVTNWIALSDATTENSCLHVIPKSCDPGYLEGDTEKEDPLQRALPNKESFQKIRALTRKSGQSILFDHRIIHWGSSSDEDTKDPPRIAISFVASDPKYEPPLVDPEYFTATRNPPFRIRLLLVCAQLLIYYQRFELDKDAVKACYKYCKRYEGELHETYRRKVFLEFVNAMKESNEVKVVITEEGDEEDEEDAMMQEMLDAESGGYGEFQDDYDELDESHTEDGSDDDLSNDDEETNLFGKRLAGSMHSSKSAKKPKP